MISLGRDTLSLGQTKKYGINLNDYLSDPDGSTTTISGTPTVSGVNCTGTYVSNAGGIVYFKAAAAAGLGKGAKGYVQVTTTLANTEVVPYQIDLDFA